MEKHLFALERGFAALEALSRAAAESSSPRALYGEACRIAVAHLGARMAWIGMVDAHSNVQPVAHAGHEEGYLLQSGISLRQELRAAGPTGRALREGRAVVCEDIERDPAMAPWRDAALARGFRSSAAFPIFREGDVVAMLGVYDAEPQAFSASRMRVLQAMANLLSGVASAVTVDAARGRA